MSSAAGSLTALPVIETQAGDVPLHTDERHLDHRRSDLPRARDVFNSGIRPAINVGISVSRVGGNAQIKAMKKVAGSLRIDLAQLRELEAFAKFGSDLDKSRLPSSSGARGSSSLLKQGQFVPMRWKKQVVSLFAGTNGFLDEVPLEHVARYEESFLEADGPQVCGSPRGDRRDEGPGSGHHGAAESILRQFTDSFKATIKI